jgi:hypothetical protein
VIGSTSISSGNSHRSSFHAIGTISTHAGKPYSIHLPNDTSVWASCLSCAIATRLAAVPTGVAMPPMSGPKATAIMITLPKLLPSGCTSASRRMPMPIGNSIAATAILVIHIEISTPTTRNPSSTRSVRVPTRFRM